MIIFGMKFYNNPFIGWLLIIFIIFFIASFREKSEEVKEKEKSANMQASEGK